MASFDPVKLQGLQKAVAMLNNYAIGDPLTVTAATLVKAYEFVRFAASYATRTSS